METIKVLSATPGTCDGRGEIRLREENAKVKKVTGADLHMDSHPIALQHAEDGSVRPICEFLDTLGQCDRLRKALKEEVLVALTGAPVNMEQEIRIRGRQCDRFVKPWTK